MATGARPDVDYRHCGLQMIIQCAFNFQPNSLAIGLHRLLSHSQIDQSNNQIELIVGISAISTPYPPPPPPLLSLSHSSPRQVAITCPFPYLELPQSSCSAVSVQFQCSWRLMTTEQMFFWPIIKPEQSNESGIETVSMAAEQQNNQSNANQAQSRGREGESRRQLNNRCALVFPPISGGRC